MSLLYGVGLRNGMVCWVGWHVTSARGKGYEMGEVLGKCRSSDASKGTVVTYICYIVLASREKTLLRRARARTPQYHTCKIETHLTTTPAIINTG